MGTRTPPTRPPERLEEPAYCWDCGVWMEAEDVIRGALDAYSGDSGTWCPGCGNDQIYFGPPLERTL